jgi:hypothetical protein
MLSKTDLEKIVSKVIENQEKLGEAAGGSGHLSSTSYKIQNIETPIKCEFKSQPAWEINFAYDVFVETEFTYYPDNPPYEYHYVNKVVVNEAGDILEESQKDGGMINDNLLPFGDQQYFLDDEL